MVKDKCFIAVVKILNARSILQADIHKTIAHKGTPAIEKRQSFKATRKFEKAAKKACAGESAMLKKTLKLLWAS